MSTVAEQPTTITDHSGNPTLLDLSGQEFNAMWVNENQPLFIPNNPLHWKCHKLQILIDRMDKQLEKNPAQFNSSTYMAALNELEKCQQDVRKLKHENVLDTREMAGGGNSGAAQENSSVESISMDI